MMQTDTPTKFNGCMISGFCCEVDEHYVLLGYYAASSGNSLPTFRDNLSVQFSMVYIATITGRMTIKRQYNKETQFYNILDRISLCEPISKPSLRVQFSLQLLHHSREARVSESLRTAADCMSP